MPFDLAAAPTVGVVTFADPIAAQATWQTVPHGMTVAAIVAEACGGMPWAADCLRVSISVGADRVAIVPRDHWPRVRPAAGAVVTISPHAEGAAIAPLVQLAFAAGGQWLGASVLGLSGMALNVFVAGFTIVGALAAQALVPPPPQEEEERERYFLGGTSNRLALHEAVPRVFGRHILYPPQSAVGYTEVSGDNQYLRARFCLGYGRVALEALRIGTTLIHEFEDVTLEFRGVDYAETVALHPQLTGMDVRWRSPNERMSLYSRNIAEDFYNAALPRHQIVERATRSLTEEAVVTIGFNGLAEIGKDGSLGSNTVRVRYRWRDEAKSAFFSGEVERSFTGKTRKPVYYEHRIVFPYAARWSVEVRIFSISEDGERDLFDGALRSIKSIRDGALPSPPGVAEMAIRVKATEQLNGRLDQVNAVVHAMLPVREGGAWTEPRRTRHPGAAWAALFRGGMGGEVLPDERLDLDELDAWFAEDHWTYDAVKAEGTTADWAGEICAAGRRRAMVAGFRHQPMPDRAGDHVRGFYSPHNSRGFRIEAAEWKPIHAFRCRVVSEARDWTQDDVYVYAPGYDHTNATEIETLDLPGIVLGKADGSQGNVYRLGVYHLAQAILRRETYTFEAGIDHLAHAVGDKIRAVHDVPQFGVGSGIVAKVEAVEGRLSRVWLDEPHDGAEAGERVERIEVESGAEPVALMSLDGADVAVIEPEPGWKLRMVVRQADGSGAAVLAVARPDGLGREWRVLDAVADPDAVQVGDLALIEAVAEEPVELIVLRKEALEDLGARMTCVLAAPGVLARDADDIPAYDPFITPLRVVNRDPLPPVIEELVSDERSMIRERDGSVQAAIAARVVPTEGTGAAPMFKALRWRLLDGEWQSSPWLPVGAGAITTGPLIEGQDYEVAGIVQTADGRTSILSDPRSITARALTAPPPDVTGLVMTITGQSASLVWDRQPDALDVKGYEVRYSPLLDATWRTAQPVSTVAWPANTVPVPVRAGVYLVRGVDYGGRTSLTTATATLSAEAIGEINVVEAVDYSDWAGTLAGVEAGADGFLTLAQVDGAYLGEGTFEGAAEIDLGADYPCLISVRPVVTGRSAAAVPIRDWPVLRTLGPILGADPALYSVEPQMQVMRGGAWGGWQAVSGGTVVGSAFRFRLVLRSEDGINTPVVRAFEATVDMPDRVEAGAGTAPAGGVTVTFTAPFKEPPKAVLVTPKDVPPGVTYRVTNKSRAGFDAAFFDAAGAGIAADFDFSAHGYGREAA